MAEADAWSGYQGVNVNAPTFATGVTIPTPVSGSASPVTAPSQMTGLYSLDDIVGVQTLT